MPHINEINGLFFNCSSLLSLPDISKWKLKNIKKIDNIFKGCSSLLSFPDISKWNYNNINDKINLNNITEESLSNEYSSNKENIIFNSDNINSY